MITLIAQIGNSDDKLTQQEWSSFVHEVRTSIKIYADAIHFDGASHPEAPWQNHAWIFTTVHLNGAEKIKSRLEVSRTNFRQDSIAWTEGRTEFIGSTHSPSSNE